MKKTLIKIIQRKINDGWLGGNIDKFKLVDYDEEDNGIYWCMISYKTGGLGTVGTIDITTSEIRDEKLKEILK
jgi:hypothetical protein